MHVLRGWLLSMPGHPAPYFQPHEPSEQQWRTAHLYGWRWERVYAVE